MEAVLGIKKSFVVILITLACAVFSTAAARGNADDALPHGLLPRILKPATQAMHNAVITADSEDAEATACSARLAHLRELVAKGHHEDAIDLSLALFEHPGVAPRHPHCHADKVHLGEGTLATRISRPPVSLSEKNAEAVGRTSSSSSRVESFVTLHHPQLTGAGVIEEVLSIVLGPKRPPLTKIRAAVFGFILDGRFILADAQARCRAEGVFQDNAAAAVAAAEAHASGQGLLCKNGNAAAEFRANDGHDARRLMTTMGSPLYPKFPTAEASGLVDATTSAVVGVKTFLVIPVLPNGGNESDTCSSCVWSAGCDAYCTGFNYGLVASAHGGSATSYLNAVMEKNNDFYKTGSWGAFEMSWTITPIYNLPNYDASICGGYDALGIYSGGVSTGTGASFDKMAIDAAVADGYPFASYKFTNYDYYIIFMPRCKDQGFSGIAWVGYQGALQNLYYSTDYDVSVAHELGHNFGANHASYITQGSRGAAVYENAAGAADDFSFGWIEYGNPHSTMGQGNLMDYQVDFVIEGKSVFDWLDHGATIEEAVPYASIDVPGCTGESPCGPYYIYPTDLGSYPTGSKLGVQISTLTANIYFFVEHRTSSTLGNAALITWSRIDNYGMTGRYGNSVLVDCTPETTSFIDAGCLPGSSIILDIGSAVVPVLFSVNVGALQPDGTLPITVESSPTPSPTASFAPSPQPTSFCADNEDYYEVSLIDTYGDGWNSATMQVSDCCGTVRMRELGIADGFAATGKFCMPVWQSGVSVSWNAGTYDSETAWVITKDGTVVLSDADGGNVDNCASSPVCSDPSSTSPSKEPGYSPIPVPVAAPSAKPTISPTASFAPSPQPTRFCADGENHYEVSLMDTWGDGWNSATMQVSDCCGTVRMNELGMADGYAASGKFCMHVWQSGVNVSWNAGAFDFETAWVITKDGTVVLSDADGGNVDNCASSPVCSEPIPSAKPTTSPTKEPTLRPTVAPSRPTPLPFPLPSTRPSLRPTKVPTPGPSRPTLTPFPAPTAEPTAQPTKTPTSVPTASPSSVPTPRPSGVPTSFPTALPSTRPSQVPSPRPSPFPSLRPTPLPTTKPSSLPTPKPTLLPSPSPTTTPTTADTVTVAVSVGMAATQPASEGDKASLKSTTAVSLGVSESSIKGFTVTSTTARRRRRSLLAGYQWTVSFEVLQQLSATSATSPTNFAAQVAAVVASPGYASAVASSAGASVDAASITTVLETRHPSPAPSMLPIPRPTQAPVTPAPSAGIPKSVDNATIGILLGVGIALFFLAGGGLVWWWHRREQEKANVAVPPSKQGVNAAEVRSRHRPSQKAAPEVEDAIFKAAFRTPNPSVVVLDVRAVGDDEAGTALDPPAPKPPGAGGEELRRRSSNAAPRRPGNTAAKLVALRSDLKSSGSSVGESAAASTVVPLSPSSGAGATSPTKPMQVKREPSLREWSGKKASVSL